MLDVTLELITQSASSSLLAFCFCNLIIVIILLGSKPGSEFDREQSHTPLPIVSNTSMNEKESKIPKGVSDERINELMVISNEVLNDQKELVDDKEGRSDDDNGDQGKEEEEEVEEEEDDDDDELRKRVEEFIEKVNKGWKAELLSTSL